MPGYWLRILVYQDLPGLFVARSLEHDISVDGTTLDRTLDWILRIIRAHAEFDERHGRRALSTFPEAPQRFWAAFEQATPLRTVSFGKESILVAFSHERPLAHRLPTKVLAEALAKASLPVHDPARPVAAR